MRNQTKAYAYGLTAVLLWSTVASAFKLSLRHVDPFQLLVYACAVSILVLSVILSWQGRWRLVLSYSGRQYAQSLALGILNPFLYYLVLFKAYDLLPAQEAQPLNYTWALTLTFLSVPLLGQRLGVREVLAGLVSYSGVVVIAVRGDVSGLRFSDPAGVGLALGSTVIWALYWIYNTRDDRDPVAGLWLNFVFGFPFVLAACWLYSDLRITQPVRPVGRRLRGNVRDGAHLRVLADGAAAGNPTPRRSGTSFSSRRFSPWYLSTCWSARPSASTRSPAWG